jgi:hypothetical protein
MVDKLKSISRVQILAIALIVFGLGLVIHYGRGAVHAYRAMQFAEFHEFDAGHLDPDLIRPWMTIRYIAVAYAVPQEFLFSELDIPMARRNSETPLYRLNNEFDWGQSAQGPWPAIVDKVRAAILAYRADPVTTGLRERGVRPWMSVQYISNSTGIPPQYIFEQIGLPLAGNAYMPLEKLSDETRYEGGTRALVRKIQNLVDTYEANP